MNTSQQNPLIPDILVILRRNLASGSASAFGIHHLLTELTDHPVFASLDSNSELSLFKKNFLMMNGLYQLQVSLWRDDHVLLQIESLDVRLLTGHQPSASGDGSAKTSLSADRMSEYYLDWRHYHEATQEHVEALLDSFWRRFDKAELQYEALQCLGLNEGASIEEIKLRYQTLAREHHPDRGGDTARFIEVRQAYEALRC